MTTLQGFLPMLASHLWSSTIFLAVVLVAIFLTRKRLTAGARFSLALIGILKFAIPAALLEPLIRRVTSPGSLGALELPLQRVGGALRFTPDSTALSTWPAIVVILWLAVAAVLILRYTLTRHRLVSRSVRTALPAMPREIEALSRARRRVGVRRPMEIARSPLAESPGVLRMVRPLVVLPTSGCDELTDEELESLLCHECAHVARHDNLIARIESVISALFWFHPLIWIAQQVTRIERERACDEVVAESAEERETYLAALTKFCHAAIAPRLPGVSCMATANLKERMDHVMNYPELRIQAPSPKRITVMAAAALALFTLAAGIVGVNDAFAGHDKKKKSAPYAVKLSASRSGEAITLQGLVTDNKTLEILAAPKMTFQAGTAASATSSGPGFEVVFDVLPGAADRIAVNVSVMKDGQAVQRQRNIIILEAGEIASPSKYTGDPISLNLKDADLRHVLTTFGKLTNMNIQMDDAVQGTVSVNWTNVPWDQAFDTLIKEKGLTYRIEGSTIKVSK